MEVAYPSPVPDQSPASRVRAAAKSSVGVPHARGGATGGDTTPVSATPWRSGVIRDAATRATTLAATGATASWMSPRECLRIGAGRRPLKRHESPRVFRSETRGSSGFRLCLMQAL